MLAGDFAALNRGAKTLAEVGNRARRLAETGETPELSATLLDGACRLFDRAGEEAQVAATRQRLEDCRHPFRVSGDVATLKLGVFGEIDFVRCPTGTVDLVLQWPKVRTRAVTISRPHWITKYPPCLVGDALYGCDSVWRICERYGWKYITTFKEGRTPDLYANVEHRFVNETDANRVWYCLMMMAWTIWQMFQRGFLLRLEVGCRKMTQLLRCEMIRTYIRCFGCVMLEPRYTLMSRKNL